MARAAKLCTTGSPVARAKGGRVKKGPPVTPRAGATPAAAGVGLRPSMPSAAGLGAMSGAPQGVPLKRGGRAKGGAGSGVGRLQNNK